MQLDQICRICLKRGALKPLFTTKCTVKKIKISCVEMLKFCSDKSVDENDGFPKQICSKCISKLSSAYKFKKLCDSTFAKINNFLLNYVKEENLKDELTSLELEDNAEESIRNEGLDNFADGISVHGDDYANENDNDELFDNEKVQLKKLKRARKASPPYFCEPCQKTFRNEKLHKERVHGERSPSQCERCAAVFLKPYSLSLHMRQHDNNLPCLCTYPGCGRAFAIPSMLKQHATSHTDDRPFVCQYCSHGARTKQQLMIHIRYHHTKEKNYKCSFCEKAFVSYQARYNHEKRHKNIRDHRCQLCEKSFVAASNLVYHMLTHTGEKKFECRLCGTKFGRKAHRNKHETNVHGVAPSLDASFGCSTLVRLNRRNKNEVKSSLGIPASQDSNRTQGEQSKGNDITLDDS